ncbi:MAG: ATP-binding protein [Aquificota bacterium]|nr:ATP-binding protein [Aquificota bacterium]
MWEVQSGRENLAYTGIRRVALEGRKFRLGLVAVTQRPASISKFILSQLNTQVIFKLITRNDLEAVSVFFEHSKEDVFRLLPSLKPGTAFITGLGVPFGFLFSMEEIPCW